MHSTYINDNKASRWPFAAGASIPFSDSSVLGLGVCIAMCNGTAPAAVSVCAADISDDRVALALMVDNDYIGTIEAPMDGYGTMPARAYITTGVEARVSAWMQAGDALVKGSWRTDIPVDPSCVVVVPAECHDKMHGMTVNSVSHSLPESLELATAGQYIRLYQDGEDRITLDGTMLPRDTYNAAGGLMLQVGKVKYSMASSRGQTLYLEFDSNGGGSRISVKAYKGDAYKGNQGLLVIRIKGTGQFPHCYGTADEADESDSYNI